MLSTQILIAKSPLAPFTSFIYTIEEKGLVLQGKILGLSHFLRLLCLVLRNVVIMTAVLLVEATPG